MIRAYRLRTSANPGKLDAVAAILPAWQRGLVHVQYMQVSKLKAGISRLGWLGGREAKSLPTYLSQRQWKSVVNQANAALESWQEAAKTGIRDMIRQLDMSDERLREQLYRINAHTAWWATETVLGSQRGVLVSEAALEKARILVQAWLKLHPFPDLSRVRTMAMNSTIASVSTSETRHADYWVKVATLTKGKPVHIPLHGYPYFEDAAGQVGNFCQVIVSEGGDVAFTLVKKSRPAPLRRRGESIGLDWGLKNIFTTSDGQLLGQQLYTWLVRLDTELTELTAALQRQGIRPRDCKRYLGLNRRIREYVRNEVSRLLNQIAARDIRELVVEKLNFRMGGLSARLNRLVSRSGRAAVKAKLLALTETHGITVTEVNPAYTSQTCSGCAYADKRNRTSQKRFQCRFCGKKLLADINAARNILGRSHDKGGLRYLSKERTLAEIDARFRAVWRVDPADLRERQSRGRSTATSP